MACGFWFPSPTQTSLDGAMEEEERVRVID